MSSCIFLDIDGTLADFSRHALSLYLPNDEVIEEANYKIVGWDDMPRVISEYLGNEVTDAQLWQDIAREGAAFWATMPWHSWGKALVNTCARRAPVVLMTTPTWEPSCAAGKMEWIQREFPRSMHRRYALTPCKGELARRDAVLVDDGQHNYNAFLENGGSAFLIPQPWNSGFVDPREHQGDKVAAMVAKWLDNNPTTDRSYKGEDVFPGAGSF